MSKPLDGLRVVVTRPPDKAKKLTALLEERGASVLHIPTISIADPDSWAEVDASVERIRDGVYEWIAFTSVNAVEKFLSRTSDQDDLATVHVAAVGDVTRDTLTDRGVDVDVVPEEFTGEALSYSVCR